jgi:hypothetical protein
MRKRTNSPEKKETHNRRFEMLWLSLIGRIACLLGTTETALL